MMSNLSTSCREIKKPGEIPSDDERVNRTSTTEQSVSYVP